MDRCIRKHSTTISRNLGLSSPNEIVSGKDSCMSYSMHKIRSCAHTLRRDQGSGGLAGGELVTWKKFFKGWTVSFEGWNEAARWTEEEGRQAGEANAQVNIGIEAERRLWGLAALEAQRSEADGKAHQKKKTRVRQALR